ILLEPFRGLRPPGLEPFRMEPWFFILFFLLIVALWRRLSAPLVLFGLGALLLPYLSFGGGPLRFSGIERHVLLAFPAFIAAAYLCKERGWLAIGIVGISTGMLFMYTAMFSQWYNVG